MTSTDPNRVRKGPYGRRARAPEREAEQEATLLVSPTGHNVDVPPFPQAAHVPYTWTCAGCRALLAVTTIVPPLGTAIELRCHACGTVDRLASADENGVVTNAARRVMYARPSLGVEVGTLYRRGGRDR